MSRYSIDRSTKSEDSVQTVRADSGGIVGKVIIDTFTLVDSRNGQRYWRGAYRVTVTGPEGHPKTKTFKGETAWSHAESYARDAVSWLRRNESRMDEAFLTAFTHDLFGGPDS